MSRLIDAWNALRGKAQRTPDKWEGATVTMSDLSAGATRRRGEPELVALAERVTEWVAIARRINAQNCAKEPLRLFVPANEDGSKWGGKRVLSWCGKSYRRDLCTRKLNRLERKALTARCSRKAVSWTERAGDVEEVMEHPALDLLRRPNFLHSGYEFDELQFDALEVMGNAFYHIVVGQGGMPESLWPMSPLYTRVVPAEDGLIGGYWYGREGTIVDEFAPDEVHHFRFRLSHRNPYYGEGWLHDVVRSQDIWQAAHIGEQAMMENSARPDYALKAPDNWGPEQAKELQRRIESTFRGQHRRGRILVTTGTDPVPLQFSPREMEYLAGKQDLRTSILAAAGMPESMIQLNDANLASSATGHRQYQEFTLWPRLCKRGDDLTEMLLPLYGFEPGQAGFVYDSPVKADEAARATRNVQLVGAGIMTINEARAEEGMDPDEDGDVLRINGVPLDKVGQQAAAPAFGFSPSFSPTFTRPARPAESEDDDAADAEGAGGAGDGGGSKGAGCGCDPDAGGCTCGLCKATPSARTKAVTDSLQSALDRWYAEWLPRVTADGLPAGAEQALADALRPHVEAAFRDGRETGGAAAGGDGFDVVPERAIEAIDRLTGELAGDILGTETERARRIVAEGLEQGLNTSEVTQRILEGDNGGYTGARAEAIARTETAAAQTLGTVDAWEELGVRKLWQLSPDPCPQCEGFARRFNQAQAAAEPFLRVGESFEDSEGQPHTVGFRDIQGPPLHPNCRCALVPEV